MRTEMLLLLLVTDALMVRKRCRLREGKATQPIEQQAKNRSDNCILGKNNLFTEHAFVSRNSNQTTRFSPPGGGGVGQLGTRLIMPTLACRFVYACK